MIELYHFGASICAQKVRIALEEKQLEWTSIVVTDLRDPSYLELNPNGVVPTLVHDGRVLVESRLISEYIDDSFREHPLMPADAWQRFCARSWMKQVDDSLHLNVFILSFVAAMREGFLKMSDAERRHRLPLDPIKQSVALDILAKGVDSLWIDRAARRFHKLISDMEATLSADPWLAGGSYSLADADLTPYLNRLADIGLDFLWARSPGVSNWFERVKSRRSYEAAIVGHRTQADRNRFTAGAERMSHVIQEVLSGG